VTSVEQFDRTVRRILTAVMEPGVTVAYEDAGIGTARPAVRLILIALVLAGDKPGRQPLGERAIPHDREVEHLRVHRGDPRQRRAHVLRAHRAEQL
jgi:hypothetical protein